MSGRLTQLGRQLRKLRHIVGDSPSADPVTTLRRATQLACDLACEHADVDDAQAGLHDLSVRGILDPALAESLAAWVASHATDVSRTAAQRDEVVAGRAMQIGRELDRFLRSLELGAPAPEIPFEPIVTRVVEDGAAKPDSTAAVPISGRILELVVRGGDATISVDDQPLPMSTASGEVVASFALAAAPTSKPEVVHVPGGVTRVVWDHEHVTLELAPDFTRVQVEQPPRA